jgi:hypothetical protein
MSHPAIFWLVPVLFALHNLEEGLGLFIQPGQAMIPGGKEYHPSQFIIGVVLLTILVIAGTAWGMSHPEAQISFAVIAGFQAVIFMNAVFPHLVALYKTKRYHPGLGTAVLINIPFSLFLFGKMIFEGWIDIGILLGLLAAAPILMILFIQGALAAASKIHSAFSVSE